MSDQPKETKAQRAEPRPAISEIIPASEMMTNDFLARYLSFLFVTGYWIDRAGGASGTMKKITRAQIEAERVPVPSIEEQHSIVARLAGEMTQSAHLQSAISNRRAALDRLPAALLSEAFNGRM